MGKSAVLTGLLALIMLLTGCSTGGKEFAIGEAAMLEITDGSTGETIQVTDPEAIRYIADNLNAMGFSHAGTAEGAGWTYGLTWFDHQGKPFETIFLMGDGYTILYEGRYAKGMEADQEIDLAFVESLLANGRAMDWGIALSAVDVQPTGLTLVIAQSGGHPTGRLQYGSDYTLEVLQDGYGSRCPMRWKGTWAGRRKRIWSPWRPAWRRTSSGRSFTGPFPPGPTGSARPLWTSGRRGTTIPRPIGPPLRSGECRSFPAGQAMGNAGDAGIKC